MTVCISRSRLFRVHYLIALCVLLTACVATAPTLATTSGKPEISTTASIQAIKQELERQMAAHKVYLVSVQENTMVFEGEADKTSTFLTTNLSTGAKPKARYRTNIIDMGQNRRVLLTKFITTPGTRQNPGDSEKEITKSSDLQELQSLLERTKAALESKLRR